MAPLIVDAPPVGALAAIIGLHAEYYARHWGFGRGFEAKVAQGLGGFALSLPHPDCGWWVALDGATVLGGVVIDGRAQPDARLRWFIVADGARGTGLGRDLLRTALEFCGRRGFAEVWLTTFAGLDAARRLYEAHGFVLEHEARDAGWGVEVTEQRFRLRLGGN